MTRILVVDDEAQVRTMVGAYLTRAGYIVDLAESGAQVLEMIESGLIPDLIIVDLRMPGMNGNELIARLASSHAATVPKLLLTAAIHDLREDLHSELSGAVEKPFAFKDLLEAITESLRARV